MPVLGGQVWENGFFLLLILCGSGCGEIESDGGGEMTLPDNDMVNSVDGPLRPEPWGLFFFITIIIFSSRFLQYGDLWTGPTKKWSPLLVQQKKSQVDSNRKDEGHGVVHHVQWDHHQSYFLHPYQNASLQGRQIQCRKDKMQVSHVGKNITERNSLALFLLVNLKGVLKLYLGLDLGLI